MIYQSFITIVPEAINFPEFLEIMSSLVHKNTNSEILDAFQAYDDKGTGLIHVNDLKRILQTTGQKLSSQDGMTV